MTKYALRAKPAPRMQFMHALSSQSPYDEIFINRAARFQFGHPGPNLVLPAHLRLHRFPRSDGCSSALSTPKFSWLRSERSPRTRGSPINGGAMHVPLGRLITTNGSRKVSQNFPRGYSAAGRRRKAGAKDYIEFWERLRQRILDEKQPSRASLPQTMPGPLWIGPCLDFLAHRKAPYQEVNLSEGRIRSCKCCAL